MNWEYVMKNMTELRRSDGGYSNTKKGVICLDGVKYFIKIGLDTRNKLWVAKEIEVYRWLASVGYRHAPRFVASSPTGDGMLIDFLGGGDGWDWSSSWTPDRLKATLQAIDELQSLTKIWKSESVYLDEIGEDDGGFWQRLVDDRTQFENLQGLISGSALINLSTMQSLARDARDFNLQSDCLAHYDLRSDNVGWHASSQAVGIVDWSWTQMGDSRLDKTALLIDASLSGLDVSGFDGFDTLAARWLAGFWLGMAMRPGLGQLRQKQLQASLRALRLSGADVAVR
jgi:aminoglycoside phosphotransferase (APT) family kinase protein